MLRETSEIAAAISVASALSKPNSTASERPSWRAVTMSAADEMGTRVSIVVINRPLELPVQMGQALLEVQGRVNPFERQAQLHHRKGHLGLDADDYRLGSAQSKHVRDAPQRARGEGINHIQDRH